MNLKEYIETCPYSKVRIGTEKGSNFIYLGKVADLDFDSLDEEVLRIHSQKITNEEDAEAYVESFVGTAKRKVLDVFKSTCEYDTVVLNIDGVEGWKPYDAPLPKLTAENMVTSGALNLISKMYEQEIKSLMRMYQTLEMGTDTGVKHSIKASEKLILENRYGFFSDPKAIIENCKREARKAVKT